MYLINNANGASSLDNIYGVIVSIHLIHVLDKEHCQMAVNLQTKLAILGCGLHVSCYCLHLL